MSENPDIDKITLELFMNKTKFNKYISKTDPKRHSEYEQFLDNIRRYKKPILKLTTELFEDPAKPITNEVNEVFEHYVKTLIRYFKVKEIENANEYNKCDAEDEDVMFGTMDEHENHQEEEQPLSESPNMRSFWGKDRVKKSSISAFSMGVIPRKKEEEK